MIELTQKQIEQGKTLLVKLDQAGLRIQAAFWLYDKKRSVPWTLFLASSSPQLDVKENLLEAHKILAEIMQQVPSLAKSDVEIIPLDHPFIVNIATTFSTGHGIENIHMENSQFDSLFIEALHLYRLAP